MTGRLRPLIAGNWKMNGLRASLGEIALIAEASRDARESMCDLVICPPATLLRPAVEAVAAVAGARVLIGAQDCSAEPDGAFTGCISAEMIADCGARIVIVGHSERRIGYAETDCAVRAKAEAARRAGLRAIICVGETEAERRAGRALAVVARQLAGSLPREAAHCIVAYEPVWAIGTGLTPNAADIAEAHGCIRSELAAALGAAAARAVPILYGGSVKPGNAAEILSIPDVDGALVGGASLKAADFLAIARAAPAGA